MVVAKRQRKEKGRKNSTIEGLKIGLGTNKQPSWLAQFTQGRLRAKRKKHIKRGAKIEPGVSLLFTSFGSAHPRATRMYFPLLVK